LGQLAHADGGPLSVPPATFPTLTGVTFSTVSFEANGRSESLKLPSIIDIVRKSLSYERTHRLYHTNELNISVSIHKTAYTEAFFSCRAACMCEAAPYSSHIKAQLLSETTSHSSLFFRFGNAASIHSTSSCGVISPREHASRFCNASYRQRLKSASLICRTLTRAEYLL